MKKLSITDLIGLVIIFTGLTTCVYFTKGDGIISTVCVASAYYLSKWIILKKEENKMKHCETCKSYHHKANILGGIAQCIKGEKELLTFWPNDACEYYQESKEDKLKAQNDYYNKYLDGALQMKAVK